MTCRNLSLHRSSQIPELYRAFMSNFIYQSLSSQECRSWKSNMNQSILYASINYLANSQSETSDLSIHSVPKETIPDPAMNKDIQQWYSSTSKNIDPSSV